MTGRVLVAGARAPRGEGSAALLKRENAELARFYGVLADISMVAHQARPLMVANDRLEPKLNDPALRDHPKRQEYVATFETRAMQIRVLRQKADPFLREFALVWERLPEERREHIRANEDGWPCERNSMALAHRLWRWMASDAFVWPSSSEAPF